MPGTSTQVTSKPVGTSNYNNQTVHALFRTRPPSRPPVHFPIGQVGNSHIHSSVIAPHGGRHKQDNALPASISIPSNCCTDRERILSKVIDVNSIRHRFIAAIALAEIDLSPRDLGSP